MQNKNKNKTHKIKKTNKHNKGSIKEKHSKNGKAAN